MIKHFIKAARLRTLPLSISGIIVGSCLGKSFSNFEQPIPSLKPSFWVTIIFWLAIFTTICFQVLSNFANDYGDGIKGTDDHRKGEKRMVGSGTISPKQMKIIIIATTIITFLSGILLIFVAFGKENFGYSLLFLAIGITAIIAAIKYTVGKNAYGYSGFGDVFVFIFFGLVNVVGSYFLYAKQIQFDVFLPAISIGLLSVSVLNLNNLRDVEEDKKTNKNTLVVKFGIKKAKRYHYILIIGALVCSVTYSILNLYSELQYLYLVAFIPLIYNIIVVYNNKIPSKLDSELKKVALSTFLFSLLFSCFHSF